MMKLVVIWMGVLFLFSCIQRKEKFKTGLEGKSMPSIDLILADGTTHFNTDSIPPGKPTVLFSFETWCPYCRAQTKAMVSNMKMLKDINIIMLCKGKASELRQFSSQYQLVDFSNIMTGIDYKKTFAYYFNTSKFPYMAIYNKDKKLNQILLGKNYISTIKEIAFD